MRVNIKTDKSKIVVNWKKKYPFARQVRHSIGHISGDLDLILSRNGILSISSQIFFQAAIFRQAQDDQYWL